MDQSEKEAYARAKAIVTARYGTDFHITSAPNSVLMLSLAIEQTDLLRGIYKLLLGNQPKPPEPATPKGGLPPVG